MATREVHLFPHEYMALLDAIRRDLRRESELALSNVHFAEFHRENARLDLRILESLSPKTKRSKCAAGGNLADSLLSKSNLPLYEGRDTTVS